MNEKQVEVPATETRERAEWKAPKLIRLEAGKAELGPNPAADAGALT